MERRISRESFLNAAARIKFSMKYPRLKIENYYDQKISQIDFHADTLIKSINEKRINLINQVNNNRKKVMGRVSEHSIFSEVYVYELIEIMKKVERCDNDDEFIKQQLEIFNEREKSLFDLFFGHNLI
jgi:hypothetical protein